MELWRDCRRSDPKRLFCFKGALSHKAAGTEAAKIVVL